ncbi:hypothetical protein F5Y16DRAFT_396486 [Xylariaceae sp. FL0255]|nr:hypothetical protein F5Y16DRAFT_396486 [Xylariaceae sp. FL0255]
MAVEQGHLICPTTRTQQQRTSPLSGVFSALILLALLNLFVTSFSGTIPFVLIFLFRYVRVIGNFYSYFFRYKHVESPDAPTTPEPENTSPDASESPATKSSQLKNNYNVAVLMQTVPDLGNEFHECLVSILREKPAQVMICTDEAHFEQVAASVDMLLADDAFTNIRDATVVNVYKAPEANRRKQFLQCLPDVHSQVDYIIMCDDHIFLPKDFIKFAIAPFKHEQVAVVNVGKKVRRTQEERDSWTQAVTGKMKTLDEMKGIRNEPKDLNWIEKMAADFLNYLGCVYLDRHNVECAATYGMDRGYFVVSGRCLPMRRSFWTQDRINRYAAEQWQGKVLAADDDAWIGREAAANGFEVAFQFHEDYLLQTNVGNEGWGKFSGQLLRWAKTWFRTGTRMEADVWKQKPWTAYACHVSGLFNFARPLDFLLFWNLWHANQSLFNQRGYFVVFWLCTKVFEAHRHHFRYPRDMMYISLNIIFGWCHSFVKAFAWYDVDNVEWTGRSLGPAKKDQ